MSRITGMRALLVGALAGAILVGTGVVVGASHFTDVPNSHSFHDDIAWMADNGITSGCGGGKYCPSSNVTRGQMAVFMHNLAQIQVVAGAKINGFLTPADWTDFFDHVVGLEPTVTDNGTGNYTIDFGWDTTDSFAVCSVDSASETATDSFCTVKMLGAGGVQVRVFDALADELADAQVMLLVYGPSGEPT